MGSNYGINAEVKLQHDKVKQMPVLEKIKYFWYYEKGKVIAIVILLVASIFFIQYKLGLKEVVFQAIIGNSENLDADEISVDFLNYIGIDAEKYECTIGTEYEISALEQNDKTMTYSSRIAAMSNSGLLDVMSFDSAIFYYYAVNGMFDDLRNNYSESELAGFEGKIYYLDASEINSEIGEKLATSREEQMSEADFLKVMELDARMRKDPSNYKNPVPVGIFLGETAFVKNSQCYTETIPVVGIITNSENKDYAKQFIKYIMK